MVLEDYRQYRLPANRLESTRKRTIFCGDATSYDGTRKRFLVPRIGVDLASTVFPRLVSIASLKFCRQICIEMRFGC